MIFVCCIVSSGVFELKAMVLVCGVFYMWKPEITNLRFTIETYLNSKNKNYLYNLVSKLVYAWQSVKLDPCLIDSFFF